MSYEGETVAGFATC